MWCFLLFAVESSPSDQLPTPRVLRSAIKIAGFVQHIRPTATFGFLRILGICNNAATEAPRAHAFDPVCVCRVLYNLENQALRAFGRPLWWSTASLWLHCHCLGKCDNDCVLLLVFTVKKEKLLELAYCSKLGRTYHRMEQT